MTTIPGYRLGELIHESAKTRVFRALRESDRRSVVVKTLRAELPTERELAAFKLGFDIGRSIPSSGVIEHLALERCGSGFALVTEDYGAASLDRMALADMPLDRKLGLSVAIARALQDVHAAGVVHKDIKPHNIVLEPGSGILKLIDFGIASRLARESVAPAAPERLEGTLAYIAPEQTGRMNRVVDSRSDLYALGVTLYQLFTGHLPFVSEDPLELIHCHLARSPVPAHDRDSSVPRQVSAIVARLLAKAGEDRYQTASGVARDLERCVQELAAAGRIQAFDLGRADRPGTFRLPQKLYGRTDQVDELLRAFARASFGGCELLLVGGPAGVGKSALIQEVHEPVVARRGWYCAGKYDQYRRDIPYQALIDALRNLLGQLLTEREARVEAYRQELTEALGDGARVVAGVLPELATILGALPAPDDVAPEEARHRFNRAFVRFLGVFARQEHPLCIFLDDLQWADLPSLQLLRALVTDPAVKHLLVVGAFRSNEVSESHPLSLTIDEIVATGRSPARIDLQPLGRDSVAELLSDAFSASADEVQRLAGLVHAKTGGNPYFAGELLGALLGEGRIRFDEPAGRWTWDETAIAARSSTANVVELVTARLQSLPEATLGVVRTAASIGNAFDLRTLATVVRGTPAATARDLEPALAAGLLVPTDGAYKYMAGMDDVAAVRGDAGSEANAGYRFFHDRVHQAAYALLPERERRRLHLDIGRILLAMTPVSRLEEEVIGIATHFDMALEEIESPAERRSLATVFLRAGRRAKSSMAFAPAARFLDSGLRLLPDDAWATDAKLALALHVDAAEAAYLTERFDELERLVEIVVRRTDDVLDQVPALNLRIQARINRQRPQEALDLALDLLDRLGEPLPRRPSSLRVLAALAATRMAIGRRTPDDIAALPPMTDRRALAAMDVLRYNASSTYFLAPNLFVLFVLKMVRLALRHGNSAAAANGYELYGMLLCGAFYDADRGHAFGRLGFRVLERHPSASLAGKMSMIGGTFIRHWKEPVIDCARDLIAGWRAAVDGGDLEYGAYLVVQAFNQGVLCGWPLQDMLRRFEEHQEWMLGSRQEQSIPLLGSWVQAARHLVDGTRASSRLSGEHFDSALQVPRLEAAGHRIALAYSGMAEGFLAFVLGDLAHAEAAFRRARQHEAQLFGSFMVPSLEFYEALTTAARAATDPSRRREAHRALTRAVRLTERWAAAAPSNHAHRLALLRAERARLRGDAMGARAEYRDAIRLAAENGFLHEEALAGERLAACWQELGEPEAAALHLARARQLYSLWGAAAKVREMDAERGAQAGVAPAGSARTATVPSPSLSASTTETDDRASSALDLQSVLQASQAIAREVGLAPLLERLVAIVVQNAGAGSGFLLLRREDGFRIEAEGHGDGTVSVLGSVPLWALEERPDPPLPPSVVHYVARTRETLVCDDISADPRFRTDPWVRARGGRSVLCMPLQSRGEITAIAYLQNELAKGAFTAARVEVLELLSGQIASAIEKAELYEELESKVRARTEELELRNRFIKATFGRYLSDDVVETLLESESALELGGRKRTVTILMSDLRGFTSLSDSLPPEKVVAALNSYVGAMTDIIERHGGMIDEIIGDALLVVFGALAPRADDAARAVACALEMQLAMDDVNSRIDRGGLPPLEMGIGLNTGSVIVGNIGSRRRAKFGVVGQNVNLCGRIESYTVGGQILASPATADAAGRDRLRIDAEMVVHPAGVREPVTLCEIGGIGAPFDVALERHDDGFMDLERPVPVELWLVAGKRVSGTSKPARLVRLAPRAAEIECDDEAPEALTSVRLRLRDAGAGDGVDDEIYAKVLPRAPQDGPSRRVRFTWIGSSARSALDALRGEPPG